ncbi:uncharacterized protein LOC141900228 [Tubulanus polymorphus]|uniref:uncharacterized protein LOC141900228 n=1 Tax=Tubulanus polymorphus TaxID=672921 RepID=UPI003DA63E98
MKTSTIYQLFYLVFVSAVLTDALSDKDLRRTNKFDPTIARLLQIAGRRHHQLNAMSDLKIDAAPSKRGEMAWIWLPGQGYAEVPAELAAQVAQGGIPDKGVANKLMRYGRRR